MECIYNLMTFGIPKEGFPLKDDGAVDLTHHKRMLEIFKEQENGKLQIMVDPLRPAGSPQQPSESSESSLVLPKNVILIPGTMDILQGKGRKQQKNPGRVRLDSLVEKFWDEYEAGSRFDKTAIAEMIIVMMKESKCRFLNAVPGGYVECGDEAVRYKIAHCFRTMRGTKKRDIGKSPNSNGSNNDENASVSGSSTKKRTLSD